MTDDNQEYVKIDYKKWLHEQRRATAERHHEHEWSLIEQADNAAISTAHMALRTLIIVNGGAAITMLAFAGNLLGSEDIKIEAIKAMTGPLWWFSLGVAIAILAMAFSYFTNYFVAVSLVKKEHLYDYPFSKDTKPSKTWFRWSIAFQICAVVTGLISLYFFVHGMLDAKVAIETIPTRS